MPSVNIIRSRDFDASKVIYGKLTQNKFGGNYVPLKYKYDEEEEPQQLLIQTEKMRSPFGVSVYTNKDDPSKDPSVSLQLSFEKYEEDKNVGKALENFESFDELNVNKALENTNQWFKKEKSKEVLNELYRPCVKENNAKYAPNLKMKLPKYRGKFGMEVYNDKKEEVDLDEVVEGFSKNCQVTALLDVSGLTFVGNNFNPSVKVIQMRVWKPKRVQGFSFLPDSGDESSEVDDE